MQRTVIINRQDAEVRRENQNDTEYFIAPVVLVKPGVLNGQYLPEEELNQQAVIESWNDVPITINHPKYRGQSVPARRKEIVDNELIGRIYNAEYDEKLKGEAWINAEKLKEKAQDNEDAADCYEKLDNNEPFDVSTGYFSDVEQSSGNHDGEDYEGIQRNIRPDHLAALPNQEGAMSLDDGVGMVVNHYKGGDDMDEDIQKEELTKLQKAYKLLTNVFQNKEGDDVKTNARDDYDKRELAGGMAAYWEISTGEALEILDGIDPEGEGNIDRDVLAVLVAREYEGVDPVEVQETLAGLENNAGDKEDYEENESEKTEELAENEEVENGEATEENSETEEELEEKEEGGDDMEVTNAIKEYFQNELGMKPEEFKDQIEELKENKKQEKESIIDDIVANSEDYEEDDREALKSMPKKTLKKLKKNMQVVNFAGRGFPKTNANDEDVETTEDRLNKLKGSDK